jgi:hypothetical protein
MFCGIFLIRVIIVSLILITCLYISLLINKKFSNSYKIFAKTINIIISRTCLFQIFLVKKGFVLEY